jgi:hypothetical protein
LLQLLRLLLLLLTWRLHLLLRSLLLSWRLLLLCLLLLLLYACRHLLLGLLPICWCLLLDLCFVCCHVFFEDLHHVCFKTEWPNMHLHQQIWHRVCEVQLHFGPAVLLLLQADLACSQEQQ